MGCHFCKRHAILWRWLRAGSWRCRLPTRVKLETITYFSHALSMADTLCVMSLTWNFNRKAVLAELAVLQLLSHNQYVILKADQLHFGHTQSFTHILQ